MINLKSRICTPLLLDYLCRFYCLTFVAKNVILMLFLSEFSNYLNLFSIIAFTEAWLTADRDKAFSLPGFYSVNLYRNCERRPFLCTVIQLIFLSFGEHPSFWARITCFSLSF